MSESHEQQVARRVLWVTPTMSSRFGGPTTTVANGVTAERTAGCRSDLLTTVGPEGPGDSEAAIERVRRSGATVHVFRRRSASASVETWGVSLRAVLWMFRHVRGYDVLHLQYVWCITSLAGCVIGKAWGVPVVVTPHESLTKYDINVASRSLFRRLLKKVLHRLYTRMVDCVVFMSRLEARDTNAGNRRSRVIFHAVSPAADASLIRRSPAPDGPLRILFVGRNARKKGVESLLRSITSESGWQLRVAGSTGTSEQHAICSEGDIRDRVRWLGFVERPETLMADSDVLVMPSEYEAFGMVAAEAMGAGVPVIVPDQSGIAELVTEYEAGLTFEENDPEHLTASLVAFDRERENWTSFSENGIRAVEENLTFSAYAKATGELYESLSAAG
jgi:glycosyltransferase involved in cell wall biosynthesis